MTEKYQVNDKFISALVLKAIYIFIVILYFAALLSVVYGDYLYSDYDTALYWFNEIIKACVPIQNIALLYYFITETIKK